MTRARPKSRPFRIERTVYQGRRSIVLQVRAHGTCFAGVADAPLGLRFRQETATHFRWQLQDARTALRKLQPRRHNPTHLGCYPEERARAIAECKHVRAYLEHEERWTGGPLGRALTEVLHHSAQPYLTCQQVSQAVGTDRYEAYVAVYNANAKLAGIPPYQPNRWRG